MWILQHVQFLSEFLIPDSERDGLGSWQLQQRHPPDCWDLPPTLRSKRTIRCIHGRGPQTNFRAPIRTQVPPDAVDSRLRFTRRRLATAEVGIVTGLALTTTGLGRAAFDLTHFLAAGIGDGQFGHVLLS